MTELPKEDIKLFSEGRGRYNIVEGTKVYHFDFPITNSIEENLNIINFINIEINKHIEKSKQDSQKKDNIIELTEEEFKNSTVKE